MNRKVDYQTLVCLLSLKWFLSAGVIFIRPVIKTYIFKLTHRWLQFFAHLHNILFTYAGKETVK